MRLGRRVDIAEAGHLVAVERPERLADELDARAVQPPRTIPTEVSMRSLSVLALLAGAALRGCRVAVIEPSVDNVPVATSQSAR